MFVRKVKNRSGSISVQVISKEKGHYRVIRTVGTSRDPEEIERLVSEAKREAQRADSTQGKLFSMQSETDRDIQSIIETLTNSDIRTIGPELIYGRLFDRMGFGEIPDEMFRHIVIARLAYPSSKLKTVDYLYRYKGLKLSISALYAFLDRLHDRYKAQVEEIVYRHTKMQLGEILAVFYDMTTLYYETEDEDDLRKTGFSKDGKFEHPQIMLGLLVGENGLPISYDIFEGNTFEGHTLLPVLRQVQEKYGFKQPVVVADAAMLSRENLKKLEFAQYRFIIGSRIRNESENIKQAILEKASGMKDGDRFTIRRKDGTNLIITYSERRSGKDAKNREKGLKRLEKLVKTGRLTKQSINNRGYNKYLVIAGNARISIDESKVEKDKKWDGLKGYLTNTFLTPERVTEIYSHLWHIEKAFRISKTDLRIRPIHHYRKRRIEAHLCIAFVAYAIYKELEMILKNKGIEMSASRAGELTHNMYQISYILPDSNERKSRILKLDSEQQILYDAVHEI
jgi:transposase